MSDDGCKFRGESAIGQASDKRAGGADANAPNGTNPFGCGAVPEVRIAVSSPTGASSVTPG